MSIPSVWGNPNDELDAVFLAGPMGRPGGNPRPIFTRDFYSGPTHPDEQFTFGHGGEYDGRGPFVRKHGKTLQPTHSQEPIPCVVGGGSPFGPTGKAPATMGGGSDVVGQVLRQQRYPAIRNIRPETTGTIGSVARQSYQWVRDQMPEKRPFNAYPEQGNPMGPNVRQIDATIPPALEPKRYDYTGLDTSYIQEQHDTLMAKAQLMVGR